MTKVYSVRLINARQNKEIIIRLKANNCKKAKSIVEKHIKTLDGNWQLNECSLSSQLK